MATASAVETPSAHHAVNRPNMVSVGTIIWLSSELMFFAALFAMYFTLRSVTGHDGWPPETVHLNIPFATTTTTVLVLSSFTCQAGVFAAERGDVEKLRFWFIISYIMGAFFIAGQATEYTALVNEGMTMDAHGYSSVFYLTTGFHGLHVSLGLIAFLFILGRTYAEKRFTHETATSAIVVSYYWHFVDVVWIGLFGMIYILK